MKTPHLFPEASPPPPPPPDCNPKAYPRPVLRISTRKGAEHGLPIRGFWVLWLRYVRGFDGSQHCAKCLVSTSDRRVHKGMLCDTDIPLDYGAIENPYTYLCGVSAQLKYENNLHLPMLYAPGKTAQAVTHTGDIVTVSNMEALSITALPDGFRGLSRKFTTCRNFQFGVEFFESGRS